MKATTILFSALFAIGSAEAKMFDCENRSGSISEWLETAGAHAIKMSWGMSSKMLTSMDDTDVKNALLPALPKPSRLKGKGLYELSDMAYALIPNTIFKPTTKRFSITYYQRMPDAEFSAKISTLNCEESR